MASPSLAHVVTSHTLASTPQPSPSRAEVLNGLPRTPSSTATAGTASPRRHSAHTSQHCKAHSVSLPQPRPVSKAHSRSLSLSFSLRSLTPDDASALESESHGGAATKRGSVMVTPPENLPPSPPLTNHGTDEIEADSEEAVQGESRAGDHEENIAEAEAEAEGWRGQAGGAGRSRELADHDHPLGRETRGDARVVIDLEKGPDPPLPQERSRSSAEAGVQQDAGVTKPFQVIRRPKRTASPKPPRSSYYLGPPTGPTAYATPPCGQIGVHHPREIVRIERDYDHGELVQFSSSYPLELQDRITPTQFLETINALNEGLIRAHSLPGAFFDNTLAVLTLWLSTLVLESKYEREMRRLQQLVDALNAELYNPQGLNILWPRKNAFLFLEIEYY